MEVTSLSKTTIKIKGKRAAVLIDPDMSLRTKTPADCVVLFTSTAFDPAKIEGNRLTIKGAGEYEIGGIKISGVKVGGKLVYQIHVDGINLAVASSDTISSARDALTERDVLVFQAVENVDVSAIALLEPKVVVFYGDTASLEGKEGVSKVGKFSTTKDKLPEVMETVLLSV